MKTQFFLFFILLIPCRAIGMLNFDIEEQTTAMRFKNKREAMNTFLIPKSCKNKNKKCIHRFSNRLESEDLFSVKKYIIEVCEKFLRFLCFENSRIE